MSAVLENFKITLSRGTVECAVAMYSQV